MIEKRWHWFDYVLISARTVWFVSRFLDLQSQDHFNGNTAGFGSVGWGSFFMFLAFLLPPALFSLKKVSRSIVIMVELICSGGVFLYIASTLSEGLIFFCVPIFTIGYLSTRWTFVWSLPAVILPFIAKSLWDHTLPELLNGMLFDVALLFGLGYCFGTMKHSFIKMREMNRLISEQNVTLENYATQIEKLTLVEERNRLSRDLHDTIGHTLTTTIMGMNAVRYLIDTTPEEAKRNLQELIQVTRIGLDEIRIHIHQIASDKEDGPLTSVLSNIANDFARYTGTEVSVHVDGDERPVPEQVQLVLIRCLQESLTNAKRHGMADEISITLTFLQHEVSLIVKDNGHGTDQLMKGFGLQAMTDRLANLGGKIQVDSRVTEGTTVRCLVPINNFI